MLALRLRGALAGADRRRLDAALEGDGDAALDLARRHLAAVGCALPLALYLHEVPCEVLRDALTLTWACGHAQVTEASGRHLAAMFRAARFPLTVDAAAETQVWRGTIGAPLNGARKGLSWTPDRSQACWYATRYWSGRGQVGEPLVIVRTVRRAEVAAIVDWGSFREYVVDAAPAGEIDGDAADWSAEVRRRFEKSLGGFGP